ncbi:MAG: SUMF1/EgtB/PvdO family nonheme iron enzyme [Armatimonadetes bacterium]|nr:SUMF1/EgtB/PvdO family nonheme iron enzyme [Armatimonadota bacterium]NIM24188.1 SUMF1/EgtB/PvdO family nonheme iron enzyme [Armatimonadota bacterium]NIM68053.1 SUMF1/EgtB/PvdO family nonheme iron enzyme [Armatimonadota bacterium]NIM76087.1 SUMF1/EgtB/PvdO family nonheme iron enzyme [Armatimonadota bacterium]NIN05758.1 SUMF1/EgtB/PvdO family nonheme iron enzyme [Armatimonadota bacterium]
MASQKSPSFIENPKDGYQLLLVPGGKCLLGDPQIEVELPDYYLGKYTVRNKEYACFLDEVQPDEADQKKWILLDDNCRVVRAGDGYRVRGEEDKPPAQAGQGESETSGWANHPVVQVSWQGAQAYCEWAELRLASELEWEKAARGENGRTYPWGNEWDAAKCRNLQNRGNERTAIVWAYPEGRSCWGHYQMIGNLWEWCIDCYDEDAYRRYAKGDFTPSTIGEEKVLRGGAWPFDAPDIFRCAYRHSSHPSFCHHHFGFRCALGAT